MADRVPPPSPVFGVMHRKGRRDAEQGQAPMDDAAKAFEAALAEAESLRRGPHGAESATVVEQRPEFDWGTRSTVQSPFTRHGLGE